MLIFAGTKKKVVLPETRIYQIIQEGKKITILYEGGEVGKVETLYLNYETADIAVDILRSFYVAANENQGAFYF